MDSYKERWFFRLKCGNYSCIEGKSKKFAKFKWKMNHLKKLIDNVGNQYDIERRYNDTSFSVKGKNHGSRAC